VEFYTPAEFSWTYPGACSRYLPLVEEGVLRMLAIGQKTNILLIYIHIII